MLSKIGIFITTSGKGLALLLTLLIGALFPQAHGLTSWMQFLLIIMLFFAFLDIEFKRESLQKSVFWVLVANVLVAFGAYFALASFNLTLALAAFMTAIAPTAIAAPVIIGFIHRRVEYVVASVLITNIASAFIVPLVLPSLLGSDVNISVWEVLQPVLVVMFVPLLFARLVSRLSPEVQSALRKGKVVSFPIWLLNLFIISANASNFLRNESANSTTGLIQIGLVTLILCAVNFGLGALLGGRDYWQEASQSLGQKNLSFVIWIALTFINPLVAIGPVFYIVYHHMYNSWSIYHFEKQRVSLPKNIVESSRKFSGNESEPRRGELS